MARQYTLQRHSSLSARIDYPAELNPQQLAAVTAPPGPALVIAGAGSGKTRTLTYRVAYLLEQGIAPSSILLLTFTNKAAREMLERVTSLLPNDLAGLWSGTFHSIGNRILRANAEAAGFRPGFSIMDREDQGDLMDSVIVAAGIDPKEKRFPKSEVLTDIFSLCINTERTLEDVLDDKYPYFLPYFEPIQNLWKRYEARKKASNTLDFDDLLEKTLRLLQRKEEVASYYRRKFKCILVDEYQDTNKIQADFIDLLAADSQNVMVVGDDAQSIYSWRGADFQNIIDFPKRYPHAKVYKIEINYRSVPEILQLANAAITANQRQFQKELQPWRDAAKLKPALVAVGNSYEQAQFVAQRILELRDGGMELNEIAVLYRAHYHSMELQMELTRHGVPFQITSGLRFFEQAHIKDVAAYMKFATNPYDEVAFKRISRLLPGIGPRSAQQLWQAIEKSLPEAGTALPGMGTALPGLRTALSGEETAPIPSSPLIPSIPPIPLSELLLQLKVPAKSRKGWEQLAYTLAEIAPTGVPVPPSRMISSIMEAVYDDYAKAKFANYDQRKEDLNTLANFATEFSETHEFLDQLALLSGLETEDELRANSADKEMVNLSTIHQAKGLEWKVVFVIWLTEGMFPSSRSLESKEAIEEERRLFYVATTRAQDELYLSWPLMRMNAGYADTIQRPSRFLQEIPMELVEEWQVH